MAISHKPGTVFNSPETQQWAVHGQPTCPISISLFGTEFLTHFLSYKHRSIIYSNLIAHISFWLHGLSQMSKEIPIIRSHVLGPIHSPFPAFFTSIHDLKHYCHPNSPLIFWAVTANQRIPKKFQQFGPKFWDRSNGPSRPQTNRNMEKPLKIGINTSREKLLPLGVVKNSQTRDPRVACSAYNVFPSCSVDRRRSDSPYF